MSEVHLNVSGLVQGLVSVIQIVKLNQGKGSHTENEWRFLKSSISGLRNMADKFYWPY